MGPKMEHGMKQKLKPYLLPVRKVLRDGLDPYFWRLSKEEYEHTLAKVTTIEEVAAQLPRYKGCGHYKNLIAAQQPNEFRKLANKVLELNPKIVVEIGTAYGGTLFYWSRILPELRLLVSIDLPGGPYGGGYPIQRSRLFELFVADRPQVRLELLRVNSQLEETKRKLTTLLDDRPIDFLFIDGDHRYEGVKKDYELYAPLVRPGGLIVFHDIRPDSIFREVKVYQLWNEIVASGAQTEEIVQEPYCGHFGIGILTQG